MGLGNKLIVSANGFPGTNKTWRFVQDAFKEPLGALAQLAGDKTIITGVVNTAGMVSDGFITYNDEIIPFVGGTYTSTVTIVEEIENVNYNIDVNDDSVLDSLPAYRTIYAKCGTGGIDIFNFSELSSLKTIKELSNFELPEGVVIDADYVHTDYNFTLSLLNHLNSIESGAEVNIQADWNMTSPTSDAYIKNKPFRSLKVSYGQLTMLNRTQGQNQGATNQNYAYVYPPSGYTIDDLAGFMPSLNVVYYSGVVNDDDTLWCNYQIQYYNNRVVVICNNSENRATSRANYLAIWIKY